MKQVKKKTLNKNQKQPKKNKVKKRGVEHKIKRATKREFQKIKKNLKG